MSDAAHELANATKDTLVPRTKKTYDSIGTQQIALFR